MNNKDFINSVAQRAGITAKNAQKLTTAFASGIAIYNHAVGIAVGCLVSMIIGITIVLMGVPDKDGFGVASIVSRVGDGVFGIAVITSLVVMVIGMVVYNIHLFRYNVR